jgi:hypothetical protein
MYKPYTLNKMQQREMVSVKQYAEMKGCTPRAVQLAIKAGRALPGVDRVEVVGNRSIIFLNGEKVNG